MPVPASSRGGRTRRHGKPAKKDHCGTGQQHQNGCAQVGLLHDQTHGHCEQHNGHQIVQRPWAFLAFLEPPGQHERQRNLQQFTGLDDHAYIDPTGGAFFGNAKNRHRNEQDNSGGVERNCQQGELLGRNLRHDEHDCSSQCHVADVTAEAAGKIESRRIHDRQADRHQGQHP